MRGIGTKSRERWKRLGIFCLLFLLLVVLGNSVRKVYNKKKGAQEVLARMNLEMQELENREKSLENLSARLVTEEGLELELRKKFNVVGAGESVAIIVNEDLTNPDNPLDKSLWDRLKDLWNLLFD